MTSLPEAADRMEFSLPSFIWARMTPTMSSTSAITCGLASRFRSMITEKSAVVSSLVCTCKRVGADRGGHWRAGGWLRRGWGHCPGGGEARWPMAVA